MPIILAIIAGFIFYRIIKWSVKAPGRALQKKFISLGTLSGKSKDEIIGIVGAPNSISAIADGKAVLQWMATGYHIALIFNGQICEGVKHEFASR